LGCQALVEEIVAVRHRIDEDEEFVGALPVAAFVPLAPEVASMCLGLLRNGHQSGTLLLCKVDSFRFRGAQVGQMGSVGIGGREAV
jgi:hypothetical protein